MSEKSVSSADVLKSDSARDKRRILVVDDSGDTGEMMALFLRHLGYEVLVAQNGPAALALVANERIDFAFLDLGLPVMDGYKLATLLRQLPHWAETPIVAVSGYANPEARQRAKATGFTDYLVKPVDLATIARVLE